MSEKVIVQNPKRVMKDLEVAMKELPRDCGILVTTQEDCILLWHFLIPGAPDTPYYGGLYHGVLWLNSNHPLSPPSFYMITPSGRFHTSKWPFGPGKGDGNRICTSDSSYHPESWTACQSVSSLIKSFAAFMADEGSGTGGIGSINDSQANRKKMAKESLNLIQKDPVVLEYFPEIVVQLSEGTWKPPQFDASSARPNGKKVPKKVVVEPESDGELVSESDPDTEPESDTGSSVSSEDEKPVPKKPVPKKTAAKKAPVKKAPAKKTKDRKPAKESDAESDAESEDEPVAKKPAKKPAKKKTRMVAESDEDEPPVQKSRGGKKAAAKTRKTVQSSEEESDDEKPTKKKAPVKKVRGRAR